MKKLIVIFFLSFLLSDEYPEKYYTLMNEALIIFNSAENQEEYLEASNYFYRISNAVKTDWISSYYYALCNTRISMFQEDSDIKEIYLDKAFEIIKPFNNITESNDSLAVSEIQALEAMIYVAKIFINPMINGMKYGPLAGKSIEKSMKFYKKNPRPYFLDGQSKYYTPTAFGGGIDKALPLLETSLKYYEEFQAEKYWPNWGMEDCRELYEKALSEKE